ncbi:transposase [Rhizobium leguminosarum]|uniref:transposase n=1 Tax=Rhizobium ruizarguesonis TaxID=2081791 RepID=UPI0009B75927
MRTSMIMVFESVTSSTESGCPQTGITDVCCLRSFSMRFRGIFHGRTSAKLEEWIDDAIHSGLVFLARFARVLRRDIDAICNAIDLPGSNGQAERQINRLKTIKRAMYGRAGPELLRARMMPIKLTDLHKK